MIKPKEPKKSKPNDSGNVKVESHLKIWNPDTKEVYINQRTE